MNKKEIKNQIKIRHSIFKKDSNDSRIDEIRNTIIKEFQENFNNYEVDFILESLTKFGYTSNLMYDDNGMFAISCDGYQPVVYGKKRIKGQISVYMKKKQWKRTIRKALKYFLKGFKN